MSQIISRCFGVGNGSLCINAQCGLTKKAEPPPTRDVNRDSGTASANGGSGDFHEKAVKWRVGCTSVFSPKRRLKQGGNGSRFHPNSRSPAVHGWIRCPCGRSGTILLPDLPRGSPVAGPSSLRDQRPCQCFS